MILNLTSEQAKEWSAAASRSALAAEEVGLNDLARSLDALVAALDAVAADAPSDLKPDSKATLLGLLKQARDLLDVRVGVTCADCPVIYQPEVKLLAGWARQAFDILDYICRSGDTKQYG